MGTHDGGLFRVGVGFEGKETPFRLIAATKIKVNAGVRAAVHRK